LVEGAYGSIFTIYTMSKKRIVCTVTNDLNYDQRMIRICTSLSDAGYDVTLVGFERKNSKPMDQAPLQAGAITDIVTEQGKLMYAHYWFNLFFFLLFRKVDILCAIDLDTILPVYYASKISRQEACCMMLMRYLQSCAK
jgi:hypothetical protein